HLSNVGLTETIAQNFDEYVDLAVSLAGNLPRLAKLRSGLRERMAASPLCDGKRFAVHFESLLWDVWGRRRPDAAVAFHRRQAALHPGDMTAHFSLGNACFDREDIDEAIASYRRALALQPDCAAIHNNLGNALLLQGKVPDAIDSCRRAIELQPDFAEAHNNLGNALKEQGQLDEAVACYRRALDLQPNLAEAHNNLGAALFSQGQPGKAIECYERALKLRPDFAEAHNNLGNAWQSLAKLNNAVACHRRALELKPDYADACNNLGNALREQGWLADAAACCRRAAELKPDFAEAHNNLGNALKSQGRLDEAIECYRRALELKPEFRGAHSNLLYSLHYREGTTPAALARAHAAYERQHAAPLRGVWPRHANPRASERRLRVGFVSPNLGRHPVGYFLVRVLENLNRERLETVCYSDRVLTHDLTCRLKSAVTGWRDVAGLGDEQLANQIQADQIDILFDLAGHTGCNRLLVFARKPAPIQITWIGYEGTTGLEAMDYLLADRHVVPEGSERHYRERILRLPDGYLCYDPPADAPPVGPLPALTTGTVTFGSFNNLAKITEKVVETWARILRKVPTARLIMKYRGLGDEPVRRRYLDLFSAHGVEPHRVDLQPFSSYPDYLATCQQVDLALDPFPFSGGTITCESLWMGIPVVTRPGATFASRHSLSHLSNLRLSELIAKDRRDYVERAVSLAGDLPRLAELRSGLRERMAASPLCDGKQFAAHFESLLHDVWGRFVNESSGGTGCRDSLAAAIADHRAGNLSAAEARYRQILAEDQNNADAWCLLGVTAFHFNRRADAIRSISRAIELNGANVDYHDNLAAVYRSLGRLDEAARCYRRVLEINPAHGTARCRLQQILDHRRINELRTDEASDISEAALDAWIAQARDIGMLQIDSEIRSLCNFLRDKRLTHVLEIGGHHGGTFFLWCRLATGKKISLDLAGGQFGGLGEDDVSLRNDAMRNWAADVSALVGDSHDQKIREQISGILQGDQLDLLFIDGDHTYEGVKADYQMYSEFVRPGGYIVFHDIVDSHQHREQNCRVAQFWNEIAGEKIEFNAHGEWGGIGVVQRPLRPDQAEFYRYLGAVAQARGDLASAQANYRQALELNPDFTVAHNNLGNVYKELGQLDEAVACYLEAIEIQPDSPVAHNNLAVARTSQGKLHEAVASYRRGLELKPDLVQAHCNLLYTLNFCPDLDPAGVYEEHRRWNNLHATPLAKFIEPHANDRSPDRRLRVGYVSSDFSKHPVGLFLLPLLAHHDRRNFEIYCFSSVARPDEITESYRAQSHHWRDVCEMTDQQVAQMIREDQIDILVDLTMHMPGNRLLAFARKPAPVQITYLAYCGTTGLDAMDYRLTDPRLDPVGHNRGLYSEESIHLPETYWCYPDRGEIPAVAPAPAITAGHVTFGCLNNFCKVNEPTREVWIRLLKAMPESRLLLHAHPGSHRNELLTVFAGQDIAAERLEFIGYQPTADYLKAYNRVDIALDPFPLGGGTTTCDALWMGVPVVTLA
ncbi:MAG TPA: CmcI family methyltransferase, partial [Planctomycetaceae bacterium]